LRPDKFPIVQAACKQIGFVDAQQRVGAVTLLVGDGQHHAFKLTVGHWRASTEAGNLPVQTGKRQVK
jgi:hypothetical protein